jgi:acyl carrier protein
VPWRVSQCPTSLKNGTDAPSPPMMHRNLPTIAELIGLVETSTQSPPGQITADTILEFCDGWDSMGMVTFIELVGKRTDVSLRVGDLLKCRTPDALRMLLLERSNADRPVTELNPGP